MSGIKSMADELREKIRYEDTKNTTIKETVKAERPAGTTKRSASLQATEKETVAFFEALEAYQLSGSEKMLIRLDTRTTNLLKQLKLAKGIDMNKFIAYSLQTFLEQHPWISPYIKETLKNTEL